MARALDHMVLAIRDLAGMASRFAAPGHIVEDGSTSTVAVLLRDRERLRAGAANGPGECTLVGGDAKLLTLEEAGQATFGLTCTNLP